MKIPKFSALERALLFTIACHGTAMVSMLLFLLPGVPGGGSDLAHRVSYISSHPLQWRLGWFPWQLTALSDLILAIALLRTTWISRLPAYGSLGFTIGAIVLEQPAEFRWITSGIDFAQEAVKTGNLSAYMLFEQDVFRLTSHWAAFLYTIAAIYWSICLARAGAWNRTMTWLSSVLWGLLIAISLGPLVKPTLDEKLVSVGNAIGFNLMMVWFLGALYLVHKKVPTINQNKPTDG